MFYKNRWEETFGLPSINYSHFGYIYNFLYSEKILLIELIRPSRTFIFSKSLIILCLLYFKKFNNSVIS